MSSRRCVVAEARSEHQPVLVSHVLRLVDPQPGQTILDGTVGLGGHALELAPRIAPGGLYIGLDADEAMLKAADERVSRVSGAVVKLVRANYAGFPRVLEELGVRQVDAMLLDLGVNSAQLEDETRGFSFERDGPLDMRYDRSQKTTAADLVNSLSERELSDVIYEFGQDSLSRKIAKRICDARRDSRILTTQALARVVQSAYAAVGVEGSRLHPATRVFQSLRVVVNRELDNLKEFLRLAGSYLRAGGRLAVISFHSLEDGLVKKFMLQAKAAGTMRILTKSPVVADEDERRRNPRSRSAKLRVAQLIGGIVSSSASS